MIRRLIGIFRPPSHYDDDEQQNKFELLYIVLVASLCATGLLGAYYLFTAPHLVWVWLVLAAQLLLLRWMAFRYPIHQVSLWTTLSFWAMYVLGFFLIPELRPFFSGSFYIIVSLVALLLRLRYSLIMLVLALLTFWLMQYSTVGQPVIFSISFLNWLGLSTGLVALWVTISSAVYILKLTLKRARHELEQRILTDLELRLQTEYLTALHETTLQIINRLETHTLLESILHRACQIAGTHHGLIELVLPGSHEMRQELGRGVFEQFNGFHVAPGDGLSGKVWQIGEAMQIADYQTWKGHSIPYLASGCHAVVAVPMIVDKNVIGVIAIASTEIEKIFDTRQVTLLCQFANMAALALQNARLYQSAQDEIEERKRIEQKLRELNLSLEVRVQQRTAALQESNNELEAFSYSVSHDLRAPLRAITGYARILHDDFSGQLPEEGRNFVQKLQENALRMGRLIEDLLAFSRASQRKIKREATSLADLANQVYQELRENSQDERQIEFKVNDLPSVFIDYALFRQVMLNLIGNAIKYTKHRTPSMIEIGCLQQEEQLIFFVRDNGAGFDMQFADRLFGVFQRLHRDDEFEGTGVGLAIVQRIIYRHGGKIWAEAEVEKGAAFYFTIGETQNDEA